MDSVLERFSDNLTDVKYITNPAVARDDEIKKLILVLLTPEKSAVLVGKPGIGKTAIVEGLAYLIQRGEVPNALLGYRVIKFNSTSLVGKVTIDGEERLVMSLLVDELKHVNKTIDNFFRGEMWGISNIFTIFAANLQFTIHNSQSVLLAFVQNLESVRILKRFTKVRKPFVHCTLYIVIR